MKFVTSIVLVTLAACGSTPSGAQRFQVQGANPAAAKTNCSGSCDAHMTCTPDGHCVITCDDGAGQVCEVELACDGQGGCEVVRSSCSGGSCCASQAANKPVK